MRRALILSGAVIALGGAVASATMNGNGNGTIRACVAEKGFDHADHVGRAGLPPLRTLDHVEPDRPAGPEG